ncbi:MAG: PIG-L family deacetylase [Chloroflexi bacterium]|nr:MAG: PIG-L family deacetylase [Chloroflexota bacterium]
MLDYLQKAKRPLSLNLIPVSRELRLLVLAPHPDDFDAVGVTLRYFYDLGCRIDLAVVTSGASGVEDLFSGTPDLAVKAAIREEEQRASCRFFGLPDANLTFLRLPEDEEGHPMESAENAERIRRCLAENRPQIVFLPHGNDSNAGHRRTYAMFREYARMNSTPLAAFLNCDPKTIQMRPDLYTVFEQDAADWKGRLLRFHQSQHQRNLRTRQHGFDERILAVNRAIGAELSPPAAYAEVFELEFFG